MSRYQNNNSSSGGLGLGAVLTVVFVVLKLCGLIDWSWWWVLSPMWISIGLDLIIIFAIVIYYKIDERKWQRKWRNGKNGKM